MLICKYNSKTEDNKLLCITYSDKGYMIKQNETGILYNEAVDIAELINNTYRPINYTYTETDIPINKEEVIVDNDTL